MREIMKKLPEGANEKGRYKRDHYKTEREN